MSCSAGCSANNGPCSEVSWPDLGSRSACFVNRRIPGDSRSAICNLRPPVRATDPLYTRSPTECQGLLSHATDQADLNRIVGKTAHAARLQPANAAFAGIPEQTAVKCRKCADSQNVRVGASAGREINKIDQRWTTPKPMSRKLQPQRLQRRYRR